jgi:putative endonuclease
MSKGVPSTRERGAAGEDSAVRFLQQSGYEIIERNYYYQRGEIDIVAKDGAVLVFVEVKSRRSTYYGAPEESVTPKKQELLRRTAEGYVEERGIRGYGMPV